jgi:hypothetical protein
LIRTRTASFSKSSTAWRWRGEVLEQQRDGRRGVLGIELVAESLLLRPAHRCGDDVHPEPSELVLHGGESRLRRGQLRDGDHDADVLLEHVPVPGHDGGEEGVVVRGVGQVKTHPRRRHDVMQE